MGVSLALRGVKERGGSAGGRGIAGLAQRLTIRRSAGKVWPRPRLVATTKSARRRFSRSGCLAGPRTPASFSAVHARPGHRRGRAGSAGGAGGRPTTPHRRGAPPRSRREAGGMLEDGHGDAAAGARRPGSGAAERWTRGCRIASSRRNAGASPKTRRPSFWRSMPPASLRTDHGKGHFDRAHRAAARRQQPMHLGVGIVQRHTAAAAASGQRWASHADRAGQAEDDHRMPVNVVGRPSRGCATPVAPGTGVPNQASNPGLP